MAALSKSFMVSVFWELDSLLNIKDESFKPIEEVYFYGKVSALSSLIIEWNLLEEFFLFSLNPCDYSPSKRVCDPNVINTKSFMISTFWKLYSLNQCRDAVLTKSSGEIIFYQGELDCLTKIVVEFGLLSEYLNFIVDPSVYTIFYNKYKKVPNLCKD